MQTHGWMNPFLTALGQTGNVAEACRRAQISRSCVYKRQARCPAFAAQCAAVVDQVRANGWRKHFLHTLRTTGRVRVAVAACRKDAFLIYYHRRRDPAFARAWTAALQAARSSRANPRERQAAIRSVDVLGSAAQRGRRSRSPTVVLWDHATPVSAQPDEKLNVMDVRSSSGVGDERGLVASEPAQPAPFRVVPVAARSAGGATVSLVYDWRP